MCVHIVRKRDKTCSFCIVGRGMNVGQRCRLAKNCCPLRYDKQLHLYLMSVLHQTKDKTFLQRRNWEFYKFRRRFIYQRNVLNKNFLDWHKKLSKKFLWNIPNSIRHNLWRTEEVIHILIVGHLWGLLAFWHLLKGANSPGWLLLIFARTHC